MKKIKMAMAVTAVMVVFCSFVQAADFFRIAKADRTRVLEPEFETETIVKSFNVSGTFQKMMNFGFQVPFGNCGQLETYQFVPSYYPFTQPAAWVKVNPGEIVSAGWYRFVNNKTDCSDRIEVKGLEQNSWSYWAMELDPEEIGLFIQGRWSENNYFRLSTDDRRFSYDIVALPVGSSTEIKKFFTGELFYTTAKPAGFILSDSRGFLRKKMMIREIPRIIWEYEISQIIRDDETLVIIYEENYK